MKTATAAVTKTSSWHDFERDLRHDWEDWSGAERLAVRALAVSSTLFAAVYFALSLRLVG